MPTGTSDPLPRPDEGTWLESIALFQAVREGNQPAAVRLLNSSTSRDAVIGGLLSILGMFLRAEDATDRTTLDQLIAASHRAGPPPAYGARPFLPPLDI